MAFSCFATDEFWLNQSVLLFNSLEGLVFNFLLTVSIVNRTLVTRRATVIFVAQQPTSRPQHSPCQRSSTIAIARIIRGWARSRSRRRSSRNSRRRSCRRRCSTCRRRHDLWSSTVVPTRSAVPDSDQDRQEHVPPTHCPCPPQSTPAHGSKTSQPFLE